MKTLVGISGRKQSINHRRTHGADFWSLRVWNCKSHVNLPHQRGNTVVGFVVEKTSAEGFPLSNRVRKWVWSDTSTGMLAISNSGDSWTWARRIPRIFSSCHISATLSCSWSLSRERVTSMMNIFLSTFSPSIFALTTKSVWHMKLPKSIRWLTSVSNGFGEPGSETTATQGVMRCSNVRSWRARGRHFSRVTTALALSIPYLYPKPDLILCECCVSMLHYKTYCVLSSLNNSSATPKTCADVEWYTKETVAY